MSVNYPYPRPVFCVDCIVFLYRGSIYPTHFLAIKRGGEPFKGQWALPGGFMEDNETPTQASSRELKEETGLNLKPDHLVGVYEDGETQRDPRQPYVNSIAFVYNVYEEVEIQAGDDAAEVEWLEITKENVQNLAFDHKQMIKDAYETNLYGDLK